VRNFCKTPLSTTIKITWTDMQCHVRDLSSVFVPYKTSFTRGLHQGASRVPLLDFSLSPHKRLISFSVLGSNPQRARGALFSFQWHVVYSLQTLWEDRAVSEQVPDPGAEVTDQGTPNRDQRVGAKQQCIVRSPDSADLLLALGTACAQ
jgi:hypothetical protein